jgi:hypothetical protein
MRIHADASWKHEFVQNLLRQLGGPISKWNLGRNPELDSVLNPEQDPDPNL